MALTNEATALSDDYRRRQAQVAAYLVGQLGQLWPMLDPYRLEDTRGPWLKAVTAAIAQGHMASATLAAAFLPQLRTLERVPGAAPRVPVGTADLARIIAAQAYLGPVRALTRIGEGMPPADSWRIARDQTLAVGSQHALDGGREHTLATVHADRRAVGWVRVCSASSCAFCQMLASRVHYKSQATAKFQAHPGCHCAAEPAYSRDPASWPPRTRILAEEWGHVTKGLSGADARLAWRRHVEGTAAGLDDAGAAAAATARTAGVMAPTRDATKTAAGRGAALPRPAGGTTAAGGRGRALKRVVTAAEDPAVRHQVNVTQLRVLRDSLAKLEARAGAGEDVAQAVTWQRQRIAQLEHALGPAADTAGGGEAASASAAVTADAAKAAAAAAQEATAAAAEAATVATEEAASAAEEAAAAAGATVDDAGVPWRLTGDYLEGLDEDGLDALVDALGDRIADGNPRELDRWDDLELWLDYRDRYDAIVAQAGRVPDEQITADLADLQRDRGRVGLTHTADEQAATVDAAKSAAGRPSKADVQEDFALYVEELYVRAEAYCRTHMLNGKGQARGISAKSLMSGDVRRVYRYGSPELLEFFESEGRRYQFAEFYAERTGSQAFGDLVARQQRLNAGIDRDKSALDLVTNREA